MSNIISAWLPKHACMAYDDATAEKKGGEVHDMLLCHLDCCGRLCPLVPADLSLYMLSHELLVGMWWWLSWCCVLTYG